mgnify:CR=1 FL=1|jgi:hypothetical protein
MTSETLPNLPHGQNFVCISFLTDSENKTTLTSTRIGGVYNTYEKACERAKEIQQQDPAFSVYVGDMGRWLPFDPAPDSHMIEETEYADEKLNELMKGYHANQQKAQIFHEYRKNNKMLENINENLTEGHKNKNEITTKLKKAKTMNEVTTLTNSLENIESQMKRMTSKLKDLELKQSNLQQKLGTSSIEE